MRVSVDVSGAVVVNQRNAAGDAVLLRAGNEAVIDQDIALTWTGSVVLQSGCRDDLWVDGPLFRYGGQPPADSGPLRTDKLRLDRLVGGRVALTARTWSLATW